MYGTCMTPSILVTGALGNVGSHVVDELLSAGAPVRAAGRRRAAVADRFGDGPEAVELDFTAPATWSAAFDGVSTMLVVRPPQLGDVKRDMLPALRAARSAGVQHMVLLSLQGAERSKIVPHAHLEAWLRESGVRWTFVRPSFFMENLSTTHRQDIALESRIVVPAGRGRTSFVAAADVAAVAAAALLDPASHAGRAWTPTGPEALTYDEVAAVLTDVLGRRVTYERPGALRYALHARRALGMAWGLVGVTTAIYTVARMGKADGMTDDVYAVTGRAPTSFREWAAANQEVWA